MLTVITPATYKELVTLEAVKTELEISGTADDVFLARLIREASADISAYCNMVFPAATVRETFRLSTGLLYPECGLPATAADGACRGVSGLLLRRLPVIDLVSVKEEGVVVPLEEVEVDTESGLLRRTNDGWQAGWWIPTVVVEYRAGYEQADLPEDISRVCIDLVKLRYFSRSRDPALRSERILDVVESSYTTLNSATTKRGLPLEIAGRLDGRYRRSL